MLLEQRLDAEAEARRLRRLEAQLVRRINRIDDDLAASLRAAYASAAQDLTRILQDAFYRYGATNWSITDVGQYQRQQFLLDQLTARIDALTARISLDLRDDLSRAYEESYSGRQWLLSQSIPAGTVLNLPLLPEQAALAAIAFPYDGANFFERMGDNAAEFTRKMRRSIVASQIAGEGVRQAQLRLAQELGWPISRRTKAEAIANKGHFARTELIARTELLRSSNLGAAAVDEANRDILEGWEWVATRDSRTDAQCAALDGRVFSLDNDRSRPPLHPRCRCTSIPVRRSNRALGLPDVPSEFPARQTYADWAREQGVDIRALRPSRRRVTVAPPTPTYREIQSAEGYQDWFSKNWKAKNSDFFTAKDFNAIDQYKRELYQPINEQLRAGRMFNSAMQGIVDDMDKAIAKQVTPEGIYAFRAVRGVSLDVGDVITDKAFVSTSLKREFAERWEGPSNAAVIRIKVPKGTNAMVLDDTWNYEAEMLLPRELNMRITSKYLLNGKQYVDVEIVPNG